MEDQRNTAARNINYAMKPETLSSTMPASHQRKMDFQGKQEGFCRKIQLGYDMFTQVEEVLE